MSSGRCGLTVLVWVGLLYSYGVNQVDRLRLPASSVGRILKRKNPPVRPVQTPTKFDLAINRKTARSLGLTVPPTLLATADEVIE